MHDNSIEYLILKWTLGGVFVGICLIFASKVFGLLIAYVESGKIWEDLKAHLLDVGKGFTK